MNESMGHIGGRFGLSLQITPSEMEAIVCGSTAEKRHTIHKIFTDGRAIIDGERYIPGHIIGDYNNRHRMHYVRFISATVRVMSAKMSLASGAS